MNLTQFTKNGKYLMLALDHRGHFKKLINPQNPDAVTDEQAISLKHEIIMAIKDQMSGLLIDETYGLDSIASLQNDISPYLLPVEKSGFRDEAGERITEVEYSVDQLIGYGASGAKLLLHFNPHYESCSKQIETALKVQQECQQKDFPFFLEIVVYEKDNGDIKKDRPELVIKSLAELIAGGIKPDVWKLEYPGNEQAPGHAGKDACELITQTVTGTPWVLLTRGDTFDVFKEELKIAVAAGCVGFLAGRALWQEVTQLSGDEKQQFLTTTLPDRFKEISDTVIAFSGSRVL